MRGSLKPFRLITVALVSALVLYGAAATSLAAIVEDTNPGLALKAVANHAGANEAAADQALAAQQFGIANRHARRALERSPLAPAALRVLGFVALQDAKPALAQARLDTAYRLTRRDALTNLWKIEEAVQKGDAALAIERMDLAMRVSRDVQALVFPVLANALADPTYLPPALPVIRQNPNWLREFVIVSAQQGRAVENISKLLIDAGSPMIGDRDISGTLIAALAAAGAYDTARRYFELDPVARKIATDNPSLLFDPKFELAGGAAPFAWQYRSEFGLGAQRGSEGVALEARQGKAGPVLTQVLTLAPGGYRLTAIGQIDPPAAARWSVRCIGKNETDLLGAGPGVTGLAASFTIPAGCPAQQLELVLDGNNVDGEMRGTLSRVTLERR